VDTRTALRLGFCWRRKGASEEELLVDASELRVMVKCCRETLVGTK